MFFTVASTTTPDLDGDYLPDAWEMHHFAFTFNPNPDPDSDSHSNLLEFALGTDPDSGADQPKLTLIPASGETPREIVYPQRAGGSGGIGTTYTAAGLRYIVEISSDLRTWQSGPSVVEWSNRREALTDGMERVGIHINDPSLNSAPQVFARIRIHPEE